MSLCVVLNLFDRLSCDVLVNVVLFCFVSRICPTVCQCVCLSVCLSARLADCVIAVRVFYFIIICCIFCVAGLCPCACSCVCLFALP